MEKSKKIGLLARLALLTSTLIWGSTFVILKNALDSIPTYFILAFRFLAAAILLSIIFCKKLKQLNWSYVWQGAIIGAFLAAAYIFQTFGLLGTTPGKNAFLTAVYCVLVPFLLWIFYRKRPDAYNFIAAVTCLVGIGLVSLDGDFSISTGDWLTLVGGLFFGLHIVFVSAFNKDKDPVLLTIVQFAATGIICAVLSLCTETMPAEISTGALLEIAYLALFGTTVAMLFQNISQKYIPSSSVAIILTFEAMFGVMFSVIFYHEVLTLKIAVGFVLIFIAVLISETKLEFLRKKKQPSESNDSLTDDNSDKEK